ncbi:hypothetical protein GGX14DRAFT_607263 [Mycena pura]|uniref:Uncharacterized protein n=1 Tax=Mycena pura TaxID=153505 RepID=A0AAD6VQ16_9AGAR|nr:hypothetical protein GGX14DRAFT_607263 [Mycena pura]
MSVASSSTGYRAPAPAVQPPSINDTSTPKPIDQCPSHTAPISHLRLHTPASSVDKAIKLFDDIERLDFVAYGQVFTFEDVDAETWDAFDREHRESCDCKCGAHNVCSGCTDRAQSQRIEYFAEDMTVTCAGGVHGSFTAVVQPFYKVVSTLSDAFRVEHNRDIDIASSSSKRRSTRVPDFAFATDDVPPKYLLLLQCAWSQPFPNVNAKALQLLTLKSVRVVVVICIDVQAGTIGSPDVPPPEKYPIFNENDFPDDRKLLSNVVFQGTIWARGIKKITVHLYQREYHTESYDITPGADGLDAAQKKIALFLANFLATTLGKDQLLKVFNPEDPFFVDWDAFYRGIDSALVVDGFERYKDWAVQIAEDPDIVKSPPPKKRQASEELPDWLRSISKLAAIGGRGRRTASTGFHTAALARSSEMGEVVGAPAQHSVGAEMFLLSRSAAA